MEIFLANLQIKLDRIERPHWVFTTCSRSCRTTDHRQLRQVAVSHLAVPSRLQVTSQSYFSPVSHSHSLRDWLRGLILTCFMSSVNRQFRRLQPS